MESPIYSVSLRLQRTTKEYAYVAVPVVNDILNIDQAGTGRIDPKKLIEQAIQLAQAPSVEWYLEERQIQPHPIQKAPEPNEKRF